MGCKAEDACLNNKAGNFRGAWRDQQCKPFNNNKHGSVCWQCCDGSDNCALDLANENAGKGPNNVNAWTADMMTP